MTDLEIEEALRRIAARSPSVDPAVLERITRSFETSPTPVKPLPSPWALTLRLFVACTVVVVAGAASAGFDAVAVLAPWQRTILITTIGVLALVMARECMARWIPGSRVRMGAAALVAGGCGVLLLLLGLLFHDYRADHFVAAGVGCLEQGMLHALPAAILGAVVLRRGFATRPVIAALTGGAVSGLTGVAFLELHCTNFDAPHQLVWHTAVLPLTAALGAVITWLVVRPFSAYRA